MLDIKFIRENAELVKKNCVNRRVSIDIDKLLKLDEQRRKLIKRSEDLKALKNKKSKSKPGVKEIQEMKKIAGEIKALEKELQSLEKEYKELLFSIPNMSHPAAPIGGEEDYRVIEKKGSKPEFNFKPKDHETLMDDLDWIDFKRGAKVAGSKFYFIKGDLVRLNQALINYGINVAAKYGFELMETPDMVKKEIIEGSGFNPRGEETQIYEINDHDLNLIGTAEISVLGYHANEVLNLENGPKKYAALSHCYRTESGAYGKASKGLYRVHQFTKLEMFIFCKPNDSENLHQELLDIEKEICDGLEIPYRIIDVATGDLGGPAYRKYDIEALMVMNDEGYGEITSCSNCTDYQARRLNIKYKNGDKNEYCHTLNGTAVVLSRFPIAIIENKQKKDGSIEWPKVLKKYEKIGNFAGMGRQP